MSVNCRAYRQLHIHLSSFCVPQMFFCLIQTPQTHIQPSITPFFTIISNFNLSFYEPASDVTFSLLFCKEVTTRNLDCQHENRFYKVISVNLKVHQVKSVEICVHFDIKEGFFCGFLSNDLNYIRFFYKSNKRGKHQGAEPLLEAPHVTPDMIW